MRLEGRVEAPEDRQWPEGHVKATLQKGTFSCEELMREV